jgi:hypothetical protein
MTLRAAKAALRETEGIAGQVTVVDNDSRDGSFEQIREGARAAGWLSGETLTGPRFALIAAPHNGGFGAGNNVGIRAGLNDGLNDGRRADFIYILNSDAFPDPGAIHALLTHLQANPKTGLAGSYIHGPDGAPHSTAFRFPSVLGEFEGAVCTGIVTRLLRNSVVSLPFPQATQTVDWLAGASVMIRKEVLDQIGLFDETFFLYFEETELCHRAKRAGWATDYVRNSEVTHIGSVSTGMKEWQRTPTYWFQSRHYYFTKTHGRAYAALATVAHVAGGAIYRLRMILQGKPRRDPPHFLRDLILHALGRRPRATKRSAIAAPILPLKEPN